ncbi:MAG: VPLPA-CTERM sorting domain-containing protein, partial [Chromatiales bacterium]
IGMTGNNSMIFANLDTIPVPAAVWLMGSALGLLGFARRKKAIA